MVFNFFFIIQIILFLILYSNNERTVCYEVVNFKKSIILSATNLAKYDLSIIKMRIDQVEGDLTHTQSFILKKQTYDCYESFHFGKYDEESEKTNITINLYPFGFTTPFEKFMIILLSNPRILTTSILGLERKYSLSFQLENSFTNLDSQGYVDVSSCLPQLDDDTIYCIFGQTRDFLGFLNVRGSTLASDIFGQIIIELSVKENELIVLRDSYIEPFELKHCENTKRNVLNVFYYAKKPVLLNFAMDINGVRIESSHATWDGSQDKKLYFRPEIAIPVSVEIVHAIRESEMMDPGIILLIDEKKTIVKCQIDSQIASYTEDVYPHFLLRNPSFRFIGVDEAHTFLVATRMVFYDKIQCDDAMEYPVYSTTPGYY